MAVVTNTLPRVTLNGDGSHTPVVSDPGGSPQAYTLLSAAKGTGSAVPGVRGGDYIWRVEGAFSSGVTATLQALGLDGVTWRNVRNAANSADLTLSAEGQISLGIGQGAILRVAISGTQSTPLYSSLAGLS